MNTLLLDALNSRNEKRPPIWLMRQAGRYMPQYQKIRKKYSLLEMFHDSQIMTEVTLLPIDLLDTDAAILFADILSVLDGLGLDWDFVEGKGPVIKEPVTTQTKFQKKTDYSHTRKAISELKKSLNVPLIGFAGAPFTVASYMIEGGSSKELKKTKKWAFEDPLSFHRLLNTIVDATIEYLNVQIEEGVDCIQLFDSWAYLLNPQDFKSICLPHISRIMQSVKKKVPFIIFARGSCYFASEMISLSPHCISCDFGGSIADVRKQIPAKIALQGNLDPALLLTNPKTIEKQAKRLLYEMQGQKGYIFNLGHGIFPETPFENVKFLVDYVKAQGS